MTSSHELPQLKMNWPSDRFSDPPIVNLAAGYTMRTCTASDEADFVALMRDCGWDDWDAARMDFCKSRVLPDGWFVVSHDATQQLVASAMSLHNYTDRLPCSGTLGWVGCATEHRAQGLGTAVAAAATTRLIQAGYRDVELYTEHFRVAALRSYLRLGYVPYLYSDAVTEVWKNVCAALPWPFTPDDWLAGDRAFPTPPSDADATERRD